MPLLGKDKNLLTRWFREERPLLKALFGGTNSYKAKIKALETENKLLEEKIKCLEEELRALRLQLSYARQIPIITGSSRQGTWQMTISSSSESKEEIKRRLMELGLTEKEADGFLRYASA